ncbi:MAG: hypothetical protein ACK5O7_04580 [Holosporales bacterium]
MARYGYCILIAFFLNQPSWASQVNDSVDEGIKQQNHHTPLRLTTEITRTPVPPILLEEDSQNNRSGLLENLAGYIPGPATLLSVIPSALIVGLHYYLGGNFQTLTTHPAWMLPVVAIPVVSVAATQLESPRGKRKNRRGLFGN